MEGTKSEGSSRACSPNSDQPSTISEILGKRKRISKVEYKVRWKNSKITWESSNNLLCKSSIEEYETKEAQKQLLKITKPSNTDIEVTISLESEKGSSTTDEEVKYNIEKILMVAPTRLGLVYLVKWKGVDEADTISHHDMKTRFPQDLIKFMEKNIVFQE